MSRTPSIAMIGTGNVGAALGERLLDSGYTVTFGLRPGSEPDAALRALLERHPGCARAASAPEAAQAAQVVFVAVPGPAAVEAVRALGELGERIVVDCTNPLHWSGGPVWAPPPEGSNAAAIAAAAPGARVVKAFNGFGAEFHANPDLGGDAGPADVYIATDDAEARSTVAAIAEQAGFRAIGAGPLRNAAVLENLAMLWIHLAMVEGHGREVAFKLLARQ